MANEAQVRNFPKDYLATDFTVADNTGIEKGTIMKLSGSRTAAAGSADNDVLVGIAAREKVAGDGRTQLAIWRSGVFDCVFDSAVTAGSEVTLSGSNILKAYTTLDDEKGYVLGKVLETVPNGGGTYQVQLNLD
jgi:hypothetical protein